MVFSSKYDDEITGFAESGIVWPFFFFSFVKAGDALYLLPSFYQFA